MRNMRRFKQELSIEETVDILEKNTNGILSLIGDDGFPYGVPISYVYVDCTDRVAGDGADKACSEACEAADSACKNSGCIGHIYFHSAKAGYKVDCMTASPKACFTVVDMDKIVPEEYTSYFRSVIATGTARIIEGPERREAFMALVEKYSGSMPDEAKAHEVDNCQSACIYAIDVMQVSGKQAIELVK